MSHTPTPWKLEKFAEDGPNNWGIKADNEFWVATIQMHAATPKEANARLIVRAVNAFEPMREALEAFVKQGEPLRGKDELWSWWQDRVKVWKDARAALALADKEQP